MSGWPVEPVVWAGLTSGVLMYGRAARRVRGWQRARTTYWFVGLGVVAVALATPVATRAHDFFSVHMVQHLLLTMVGAPLMLLGAPGVLLMRSASQPARRRYNLLIHTRAVKTLTHPVFAWVFFAAVMWGSHFSNLYEIALDQAGVHALEHALYLIAGLLFWWPVVGIDPGAGRLAFPLRVVYLVLMMPVQAFLGLAIYSAEEVLYPNYSGFAGALSDQQSAAVIMWIGGDFLILGAVVLLVLAWMRHEDRAATRIDHRLGISLVDHD